MGGVYAILFLASIFLSPENPMKNGFVERESKSFDEYTVADVNMNKSSIGSEIMYSGYVDKQYGPIQPGYSASITDDGAIWVGIGAMRKTNIYKNFNFNFSLFPGLYIENGGPDLGGIIIFRSGVEMEYKINESSSISIGVDHRSNADIYDYNPGMNTFRLSFSFYLD